MARALLLHMLGAWRTGVRNRGVQALFVFALVVLALSWVTGSFSGRQPQTVALDIGISLVRLLGALLAVFWVQELIVRDVERRTTFWVLVYPASRSSYLIGRTLGVFALLGIFVAVMAAVLWLSMQLVGLGYQQSHPVQMGWHYALVFFLIYLDLMVVAGFAVLLAAEATVPMLPFFVGLGLAIAARMVGPVQHYLQSQVDEKAISAAVRPIIESLSWILPDLSRLDVRVMVLYGKNLAPADLWWSVGHVVAYLVFLLALASWWFGRREFE